MKPALKTLPRVIRVAPAGLLLTILSAGAMFAWWVAVRADREPRGRTRWLTHVPPYQN